MKKHDLAVKESQIDDTNIDMDADPAGSVMEIDDEALASVAGGCCPPGQTTALCSPCPPLSCF